MTRSSTLGAIAPGCANISGVPQPFAVAMAFNARPSSLRAALTPWRIAWRHLGLLRTRAQNEGLKLLRRRLAVQVKMGAAGRLINSVMPIARAVI
jgi:hypothetical protein